MSETDGDLVKNGILVCDSCMRARPQKTEVLELFGSRLAFGPGGETDLFVEYDGEVQCYHCIEDDHRDVLEEQL